MIAAVQDANVLIDLANAGLLDRLPLPDFRFCAVDAVLEEITETDQRAAVDKAVAAGVLGICSLAAEEFGRAVSLRQADARVSLPDVLSLVLAQSLGGILLTGDRPLRELAENLRTETHGVFWLLDRMVRANRLRPVEAVSAMDAMLRDGARLPVVECDRLRHQWTSP